MRTLGIGLKGDKCFDRIYTYAARDCRRGRCHGSAPLFTQHLTYCCTAAIAPKTRRLQDFGLSSQYQSFQKFLNRSGAISV